MADLSVAIQSEGFVKRGDGFVHRSADGDVVGERADVAIDLAGDAAGLAEANQVAGYVSGHINLLAKGIHVAVHRAFNADVIAGAIEVALDGFVFLDFHVVGLAKFRGGHSAR